MGKKGGKNKGGGEEAAEKTEEAAPVDVSDDKSPAASAAASSGETSADAPTISDSIQVAGCQETRHIEKVPYCAVCSMPYEFCEWTPLFPKCKEALATTYKDHFPEVDDLEALMGKLWIADDKAKRAQKSKGGGGGAAAPVPPAADAAAKPAGEGAAADGAAAGGEAAPAPPPKKDKKAKAEPEIVIELNNRNKKKHITIIKVRGIWMRLPPALAAADAADAADAAPLSRLLHAYLASLRFPTLILFFPLLPALPAPQITAPQGLEHFVDDAPAAAKLFGKKFACGSAYKRERRARRTALRSRARAAMSCRRSWSTSSN